MLLLLLCCGYCCCCCCCVVASGVGGFFAPVARFFVFVFKIIVDVGVVTEAVYPPTHQCFHDVITRRLTSEEIEKKLKDVVSHITSSLRHSFQQYLFIFSL